jgi:hypothetical protein
MSARYTFDLAVPADDAQLRARMAEDRMEGSIAVSFRREPSYFAGARVQGETTQVIKCVDAATGRIVGLGSRSTSLAWVDGHARRIGYLADLRGAPEVRSGVLLFRGFGYLRQLHAADPMPFYTSVIYDGNLPALRSLVGARHGLPAYQDCGRVLTPAIHLDLARRAIAIRGIEFGRGEPLEMPAIVAFLNRTLRARQFAPVYREQDFGTGRFANLAARDFFVARSNGRIVGTLAAWDQATLRQTHVERYSRSLGRLRPLYNLAARITPLKPLPAVGARIPYVYLACAAVEDDRVPLFRGLLHHACNTLRRGPWHYAIASLHERDPLAPVLGECRRIDAAGRLFVVHYPEDAATVAALEPRIPYVEAGCL